MRCPTIQELPPPPMGKTGWLWTVESDFLQGSDWPCISIIVPSYQQAAYLEENIRSVLLQGYPNIELIIMDGGSSDGSVDIIKKYEPWITKWVSEKDRGQSHAINKGFEKATGEIIGWQNSDDFYYPDAFKCAAKIFAANKDADIVHGITRIVDEGGGIKDECGPTEASVEKLLPVTRIYNQPMFIKKTALPSDVMVDESLRYCMDYDLFWKLLLGNKKFFTSPDIKGALRIHPNAKSSTQITVCWEEHFIVYARVYQVVSDIVLKNRLQHEMIQNTLNCWGHRMYRTLGVQFGTLLKLCGWRSIPPKMWIHALLSFPLSKITNSEF